jgi:hypothetical protein
MAHKVYASVVKAVKAGRMIEPFSRSDFRIACPGLGDGTYNAFLSKHREGNPGGNSELFRAVRSGLFELIKPIKYGL